MEFQTGQYPEKDTGERRSQYGLVKNARQNSQEEHTLRSKMKYVCFKCKRDVEILPGARIICPFCGYRILKKSRAGTITHVKAR